MHNILLRPAVQSDLDCLWHFLAIAAYEPDVEAAKATPIVALHLLGWQRTCDFGVIAEENGAPIGAAWARQFSRHEEPAFFVDDQTPEVSIGVQHGHRGRGVGASLMDALCADAKRRGVGLCLNVRDSNPAIRIYEKAGFRRIPGAEIKNRVGGYSLGMAWHRGSKALKAHNNGKR